MPRRKHHDEGHENHERWLVTYSDLITLLLAFFIILYSMSNLDAEKYKQLASSLGSAFGGKKGGDNLGVQGGAGGKIQPIPGQTRATPKSNSKLSPGSTAKKAAEQKAAEQKLTSKISPEFQQLAQRIQAVTDASNLQGQVVIREEGRGLVLQLVDTLLFPTGSADLSNRATNILDLVGKELGKVPNPIRVEGHTDTVPIRTWLYPNNWYLSTARAMRVVQLWDDMKLIPPTRLSGAGYGPHRPIDTNATEAGRAHNRRVDIIVIRESVAQQEPTAIVDGKLVTGTKTLDAGAVSATATTSQATTAAAGGTSAAGGTAAGSATGDTVGNGVALGKVDNRPTTTKTTGK